MKGFRGSEERKDTPGLNESFHFGPVVKAFYQVGASISLLLPSHLLGAPTTCTHSDLDHPKTPWSNSFVPVAYTQSPPLMKTMSTLGVSFLLPRSWSS